MRKSLVIAFALVTFTFNPSAAFAHAGLISSTPSANSELTEMPTEISLKFTEELMILGDEQVNTLGLNLMDGPEIALADVRVEGASLSATVPAGDYEPGTYEIFYKIVSADGHKLTDSISFSLNAPLMTTTLAIESSSGHGFFHIHKNHLIEAGGVLILIILWWAYRRFAREQGE